MSLLLEPQATEVALAGAQVVASSAPSPAAAAHIDAADDNDELDDELDNNGAGADVETSEQGTVISHDFDFSYLEGKFVRDKQIFLHVKPGKDEPDMTLRCPDYESTLNQPDVADMENVPQEFHYYVNAYGEEEYKRKQWELEFNYCAIYFFLLNRALLANPTRHLVGHIVKLFYDTIPTKRSRRTKHKLRDGKLVKDQWGNCLETSYFFPQETGLNGERARRSSTMAQTDASRAAAAAAAASDDSSSLNGCGPMRRNSKSRTSRQVTRMRTTSAASASGLIGSSSFDTVLADSPTDTDATPYDFGQVDLSDLSDLDASTIASTSPVLEHAPLPGELLNFPGMSETYPPHTDDMLYNESPMLACDSPIEDWYMDSPLTESDNLSVNDVDFGFALHRFEEYEPELAPPASDASLDPLFAHYMDLPSDV